MPNPIGELLCHCWCLAQSMVLFSGTSGDLLAVPEQALRLSWDVITAHSIAMLLLYGVAGIYHLIP